MGRLVGNEDEAAVLSGFPIALLICLNVTMTSISLVFD